MENRYHYKLNLPVKFIPNPKFFNDYPEPCHVKFSINDVNKDLQTFLISLGVYIMDVELFVRDSSTKNFIHLDGDKFSDNVKINYVYGQGLMDWYRLKSNKDIITETNTIGTKHVRANEGDCEKVWSAPIDEFGSLVNVGVLHGVSDVTNTRWCYCLILGDILNMKRLEWDRALKLFQSYY
jgi:hypothetical protein